MKSQTKRRGRPPKSSEQLQTEYLDVRCNEAEKLGFKAAADQAGMPLSAWVRQRLRQAAQRELEDTGSDVPFAPKK